MLIKNFFALLVAVYLFSSTSNAGLLNIRAYNHSTLQTNQFNSGRCISDDCTSRGEVSSESDSLTYENTTGYMYEYAGSVPDYLDGEYSGKTKSYSKGIIDSKSGEIKLEIEASANIRDLSEENEVYEPDYYYPASSSRPNTSISGSMLESLSFSIDDSLAGQELWVTFNLFMHGSGYGLRDVFGALQSDDVYRRFSDKTSVHGDRDSAIYRVGGTVDNLQHKLTMSVLLQDLGENTLNTVMTLRSTFGIASSSYEAYGNFMNTSNLYIELPDGVTMETEGGTFASAQYIPEWTKVNSVPEPSTLAIFALGMIGLASRRFKNQ